jgi:hypothetical protein
MASVGFEPTIPVFEQAKAVLVLESATIVIGNEYSGSQNVILKKDSVPWC